METKMPETILTGDNSRHAVELLVEFHEGDEAAMLAFLADPDFEAMDADGAEAQTLESMGWNVGYLSGAADCLDTTMQDVAMEIMRAKKVEESGIAGHDCPECGYALLMQQCATGIPGCLHCRNPKCDHTAVFGKHAEPSAIAKVAEPHREWIPCSTTCRGWDLFNSGNEIQRCDECDRFDTDLAAFTFAATEDLVLLRHRLQESVSANTLEKIVAERLRERFGLKDVLRLYYQGESGGTHTLRVASKDKGHGIAVLSSDGELSVTGWPEEKES